MKTANTIDLHSNPLCMCANFGQCVATRSELERFQLETAAMRAVLIRCVAFLHDYNDYHPHPGVARLVSDVDSVLQHIP